MGKRLMINFAKAGFPHYEEVEEEGMAKPCAMGIPWVNPTTLQTIEKRNIPRTGPKGEALNNLEGSPEANQEGQQSDS